MGLPTVGKYPYTHQWHPQRKVPAHPRVRVSAGAGVGQTSDTHGLTRCHAPNTVGTVNMECTVDLRLSWSER